MFKHLREWVNWVGGKKRKKRSLRPECSTIVRSTMYNRSAVALALLGVGFFILFYFLFLNSLVGKLHPMNPE
jgi:hypothetical protein